jgi:hypothetical protein
LEAPERSVSWIQASLLRLLVRDGKEPTNNDLNDVLHATVPLRYADVVVLDSAWADIAGRLKLPKTEIFPVKPAGLSAALECIRTIDISGWNLIVPS